jgi:predicted Zn-dependent protease with MMP-like domain
MTHSDDEHSPIEAAIQRAAEALENGDPESALVEAARAADPGERALMEARAYLSMDMADAATGALERAAESLGDDDVDVVELDGELALLGWNIEHARACFEAVSEVEDDVYLMERRALIADLAGDSDASHGLMEAAQRLDPERPQPVRVSDAAFDALVKEALADLPAQFQAPVSNARVITEPMPFAELGGQGGHGTVPPDVLGLFVGPTIHDAADGASGELPPSIYLFQRNLERMAQSEEDLGIEIRVTLFHEIGHLLGLDEDEVAAMGLA